MKTKTIPFDLETAKKIQAGEVEGRIAAKDGRKIRVMTLNAKHYDEQGYTPILILVELPDKSEVPVWYRENGTHLGYISQKLVLEVPDNEPVFNVGDTVSINIINSFYDADFHARYHSKLATVLFTNKYGAGVKTIISGDENYFFLMN